MRQQFLPGRRRQADEYGYAEEIVGGDEGAVGSSKEIRQEAVVRTGPSKSLLRQADEMSAFVVGGPTWAV